MAIKRTFSEQLMSRRYMQLFACILLLLILQATFQPALWMAGIASLIFLNMMLVAVSGNQAGNRARIAIFLVWFGCALSRTLVARDYSPELYLVSKALTALLLAMGVFHILRLIISRERVTLDTLFASVVVYVLIALFFANLYAIAHASIAGSLKFPDHFQLVNGHLTEIGYTYFSFVTLATLGYGDVLPGAEITQMLVSIQAVIGQFYVAVLVAWLVSLYVAHKTDGD